MNRKTHKDKFIEYVRDNPGVSASATRVGRAAGIIADHRNHYAKLVRDMIDYDELVEYKGRYYLPEYFENKILNQ